MNFDEYLTLTPDLQGFIRRKCGTAYTWDEFLVWLDTIDDETVNRWRKESAAEVSKQVSKHS